MYIGREGQIALTGGVTAVVALVESSKLKPGAIRSATDIVRSHMGFITEPDLLESLEIIHKKSPIWRDVKLGKI